MLKSMSAWYIEPYLLYIKVKSQCSLGIELYLLYAKVKSQCSFGIELHLLWNSENTFVDKYFLWSNNITFLVSSITRMPPCLTTVFL